MADGTETGLRERKIAATRLALANAVSERLKERMLSDITVDELAAAVSVSRVTFFNYFPTKEHALEHIFLVATFREQCESKRAGLTGVDALLHFARWMGDFVAESPGRARQVLGWFALRPLDRPFVELTRADRELIAKDMADEPFKPSRDRFIEGVAEARRTGALAGVPSSDYELGHMLGTLLIALAVVGHSNPNQDWRALAEHHVRRALDLDHAGSFPPPTPPSGGGARKPKPTRRKR